RLDPGVFAFARIEGAALQPSQLAEALLLPPELFARASGEGRPQVALGIRAGTEEGPRVALREKAQLRTLVERVDEQLVKGALAGSEPEFDHGGAASAARGPVQQGVQARPAVAGPDQRRAEEAVQMLPEAQDADRQPFVAIVLFEREKATEELGAPRARR